MIKSQLRIINLVISICLALLLLAFLFAIVIRPVLAQNSPPNVPPPYLEPFPTQTPLEGRESRIIPENPQSINVVTYAPLGPGDDLIHGLIYYNGYLWASTRTYPARILKIDPVTFSVVGRVIMPQYYDDAEDITAAQGYIWTILYTNPYRNVDPSRIIRIDPTSLITQTATTFPRDQFTYGASLKYAFGYLWAGGYNCLARVDPSNPGSPTYFNYSSLAIKDYIVVTALTSSGNSLWASMVQGSFDPALLFADTVLKINPLDPANTNTRTSISTILPDDIVYRNVNLYASSEISPVRTTPSTLYKFSDDLSITTTIPATTSASYGNFLNPLDPDSIWGVYTGAPGKVIKFSLDPQILSNVRLPNGYDDPSELAFDNAGNLYVSTWQKPAGIVKYSVPNSVTDLNISKSGSDAVLSWTHDPGNASRYQVWRSTQPYFIPGDSLSSKIGEVTPVGSPATYTDAGVIGDTSKNYYYVIRAVNDYGLLSPISNRVGKYAFPIQPGSGANTAWTSIAVPLNVGPLTADGVANYIYSSGSVKRVGKWDNGLQSWIFRNVHSPFPPYDYPVNTGASLLIAANSTAPTSFTWTGRVPDPGIVTNSLLQNKWNFIIIPIDRNPAIITTADALASNIQGGPSTTGMRVGKWDNGLQSWIFRNVGSPFPPANYPVFLGYPYFVLTNNLSPSSWP